MTNYEKIISELTVEKLAVEIAKHYEYCNSCPVNTCMCDYHRYCDDNIKEWLEKETEEE